MAIRLYRRPSFGYRVSLLQSAAANSGGSWLAASQIDQDTGKVLRSWGAGQFVLPHMITVDWAGDIWVTGARPSVLPGCRAVFCWDVCLPAAVQVSSRPACAPLHQWVSADSAALPACFPSGCFPCQLVVYSLLLAGLLAALLPAFRRRAAPSHQVQP